MKQGGWRQLPSVYITLLATNMSPPSRHFWTDELPKSRRWTNRSLEGCNLLLLVSATRPSTTLQNVMQNSKKKTNLVSKKTNNLTFLKIDFPFTKPLFNLFLSAYYVRPLICEVRIMKLWTSPRWTKKLWRRAWQMQDDRHHRGGLGTSGDKVGGGERQVV